VGLMKSSIDDEVRLPFTVAESNRNEVATSLADTASSLLLGAGRHAKRKMKMRFLLDGTAVEAVTIVLTLSDNKNRKIPR